MYIDGIRIYRYFSMDIYLFQSMARFISFVIRLFPIIFAYAANCQPEINAEMLLDARARLGEGAIWDYRNGELLWIDIEQDRLYFYKPALNQLKKKELGQKPGTVVPAVNGTVLIALKNGIYVLNRKDSSLQLLIPNPEKALPNNRFNDGKCDPAGRLWVGTMSMTGERYAGNLYRIDPEGSVKNMIDSVGTSNGIVWTSDHKKMYYIDTPTSHVMEFHYNALTGDIDSARVAIVIPQDLGYPDGMAIDDKDKLWIAHWGGFGVYNWDPVTGLLLMKVKVPVKNVTSCAFGGDELDILYITTAREGMSEEELILYPESGDVFIAKTGSRGVSANCFGQSGVK
jgi:sugar lactone lactonase YvrE